MRKGVAAAATPSTYNSIMNYFELLALHPVFDLDLTTLESSYFKAQREYHPDRFVGKPEAERQAAMQRSVDINNAYHTLKEPLTRARYLLHLNGVDVGTDKDTVKPSQALLMKIMELSEDPPAAEKLEQMRESSISDVEKYFNTQDWPAMAEETLRLGYLMKVHG